LNGTKLLSRTKSPQRNIFLEAAARNFKKMMLQLKTEALFPSA